MWKRHLILQRVRTHSLRIAGLVNAKNLSLFQLRTDIESSMVLKAYNPSNQEVEAEGLWLQDQIREVDSGELGLQAHCLTLWQIWVQREQPETLFWKKGGCEHYPEDRRWHTAVKIRVSLEAREAMTPSIPLHGGIPLQRNSAVR